MIGTDYPVQFSVDYPDRPLDRLTTFFRIFVAIPILIVLGTVSAGTYEASNRANTTYVIVGAGGLLFLAPLLMIPFRQNDPRRWFDGKRKPPRFSNQVPGYLALRHAHHPST